MLIEAHGLADGEPKTKAELARSYGISATTLNRLLDVAVNNLSRKNILREAVLEEVK